MFEVDQRTCIKNRAELVLKNLRFSSGADVHKVENMRHVATLIMYVVDDCTDGELEFIEQSLCRLENECVEYFRKKFEHEFHNKKPHQGS